MMVNRIYALNVEWSKMVNVTVKRTKHHNAAKGIAVGSQAGLVKTTIALQSQVKTNAPKDSGFLRASIQYLTSKLKGKVFSNLVYAMIQEFGGTIRAIAAKYLRFKTKSGRWVTTSSVKIPAANQGKGYFRPAVYTIRKKLTATMGQEIRKGIRGN